MLYRLHSAWINWKNLQPVPKLDIISLWCMIKKGDEMRLHSFYFKSNKKINDNKELDYIYIYFLIEMHKKKGHWISCLNLSKSWPQITKPNLTFFSLILSYNRQKINEKTKKEPNGSARWTLLKKSSGMRVSRAWIFMVCIFKRMVTCYLPKKIIISLPGGSLAWPTHGSYDERIFFYSRMRYISVST